MAQGQGHSSTGIPEVQDHSSHSRVDIQEEQGHSSVEITEDDSSVLAAMKEKISNIKREVSDEPPGNIKALISLNCYGVKELHVGPHSPGAREPMEKLKYQCLDHAIKRSEKNLEDYYQRMLPYKRQISESYEGSDCLHCACATRYYSDEELFGMMILDGSFILEFFRFQCFVSRRKRVFEIAVPARTGPHPIAQVERRKLPIIFRDLLQLGNQIPFLVLELLFQISHPLFQRENDNTLTIQKRLLNIIGAVSLDALGVGRDYVRRFSYDPESFEKKFGFGGLEPLHLLDLIRLCFNSPHPVKQVASGDLLQWNITLHGENIPTISKLRISGIKVEANLQNQDHCLDVAFQAGAIKMPRITLNELMCSFLKNCIEFEHRCMSASKPISSYVLLLDNLVDTADDIDYLRQHRVLEHRKKTNDEAADFINNLGIKINFDGIDPNFFILCSDVNKYYLSEPRRKWVSFKSEYIEKPWLVISVLAASVLLILTCIQTHYAIHPQK